MFEPQEGTKLFKQHVIQRSGEEGSKGEEEKERTTRVDEDGEKEDEDVLDVGDGIEGGEPMSDDVKLNDNEGGERLLVGDELVEEIAEEVEGSWT